MMKTLSLLLLSFNAWSAVFCCCQVSDCHDTQSMACSDHEKMVQAEEECGVVRQEEAEHDLADLPMLQPQCDCGNHSGETNAQFTLPKLEQRVLAAPVFWAAVTWATLQPEPEDGDKLREQRPELQPDDWLAPSLSALGRFLI